MEFNDVIRQRKSCRQFYSKPVYKKQIINLIDAARLAPSCENRQPWHYIVLEKEMKNNIADIMEKDLKLKDILEFNKPTLEDVAVASLANSIRIIREAPILILVFREPDEIWKDGDMLSIGCSIENLHLAATDQGLGSIIIRDVIYKKSRITKELDIHNMELITGIAVGYSIEIRKPTPKKDIKEVIKW